MLVSTVQTGYGGLHSCVGHGDASRSQAAVVDCLEDPDDTLRLKTLDLLARLTKANNVEVSWALGNALVSLIPKPLMFGTFCSPF